METGNLSLVIPGGNRLELPVRKIFKDGFLHLEGGDSVQRVNLVLAGHEIYGAIVTQGRQYDFEHDEAGIFLREIVPNARDLLKPDTLSVPAPSSGVAGKAARSTAIKGSTAAQAQSREAIDLLAFLDVNLVALLGENGARASWLAKTDLTTAIFANSNIQNASAVVKGFISNYQPADSTIMGSLPPFRTDEAVISQRTMFGADLATLYTKHLDSDTLCGQAYEFTLAKQSDGTYQPNPEQASYGFAVIGTGEGQPGSAGCYVSSVAHELGHILGANHDASNGGGAPYAYSNGGSCGQGAADIMAGPFYQSEIVFIYSTPTVSNKGEPCGVADSIDNARAVDQDYDVVTAYGTAPTANGTVGFAETSTSVAEDSGTLLLHLVRDGDLSVTASVEVAAVGDARSSHPATEVVDFETYVKRVDFAAGVASVDIPIDIKSVAGNTGSRDLVVVARYPLGLTLAPSATSSVSITDNTPASVLHFSSASYSAAEPAGSAVITVTRSASSVGAISIRYATSGGTATSGSDYEAIDGSLRWADGDGAAKTFSVRLLDDSIFEGDETVGLTLSSPTGDVVLDSPSTATLTIVDNEVAQPGTLQFESQTYAASETAGNVTITITRAGGSNGVVSAAYATSDGSAMSGVDYTPANGTLTWADGDSTPKAFTVAVLDDATIEGSETVNLTLGAASGGATLGSAANSVLTIADNDAPPPPPTTGGNSSSASSKSGGAFGPSGLLLFAAIGLLRHRRHRGNRRA